MRCFQPRKARYFHPSALVCLLLCVCSLLCIPPPSAVRRYFHPLEPWHLQSPDAWYAASSLFFPDLKNSTETAYRFLADAPPEDPLRLSWATQTFVSLLNSTTASNDMKKELLAGAPFDAQNRSTARVFYTVSEQPGNLWLFNFNLYYSYNGCSNQALSLALNQSADVLNVIACPFGVHESDWERISVLVCKGGDRVSQVTYSQHSWAEQADCDAGECILEDGNPVSYVALNSHANYPAVSPLTVSSKLAGGANM